MSYLKSHSQKVAESSSELFYTTLFSLLPHTASLTLLFYPFCRYYQKMIILLLLVGIYGRGPQNTSNILFIHQGKSTTQWHKLCKQHNCQCFSLLCFVPLLFIIIIIIIIIIIMAEVERQKGEWMKKEITHPAVHSPNGCKAKPGSSQYQEPRTSLRSLVVTLDMSCHFPQSLAVSWTGSRAVRTGIWMLIMQPSAYLTTPQCPLAPLFLHCFATT